MVKGFLTKCFVINNIKLFNTIKKADLILSDKLQFIETENNKIDIMEIV